MGSREQSAFGLLLGAAMDIERCGLARGSFGGEDGEKCPITAMVQQVVPPPFRIPWWESPATPAPAVYVEAVTAVNRYLGWPTPRDVYLAEDQIMAWNDADAIDAAEVAGVLRAAAYQLRALITAMRNV